MDMDKFERKWNVVIDEFVSLVSKDADAEGGDIDGVEDVVRSAVMDIYGGIVDGVDGAGDVWKLFEYSSMLFGRGLFGFVFGEADDYGKSLGFDGRIKDMWNVSVARKEMEENGFDGNEGERIEGFMAAIGIRRYSGSIDVVDGKVELSIG